MLTFAYTAEQILKAGTTVFTLSIGQSDSGVLIYIIKDLDKGMSVTNNAENVIHEVAAHIGAIPDGSVVVYKDTNGVYDELLVADGCYCNFKLLHANSADEAVYKAVIRNEGE